MVLCVFLRANLRFESGFEFGSCPFRGCALSQKFRAIFQYLGVRQRL